MVEATVYESPTRYEQARIHAAAIYCSDGRVGEQIDEFLHHGLGLPRSGAFGMWAEVLYLLSGRPPGSWAGPAHPRRR